MSAFSTFLLVCLGGAAGTAVRYLIVLASDSVLSPRNSPIAILLINVIGSFAIGFVVPWGMRHSLSPSTMAAVTTGVLGGFTTYSAFNYDLTAFLSSGDWLRGISYLTATIVGGLLAGLAGLYLGR